MYCKHCGTDIEVNVKFCQNCGAEVEETSADAKETVISSEYEEQKKALTDSVFTLGLLGLIFSASSWLALVGIILSAIAKKRAEEYEALAGALEGRAKAGRILAKIGMIVGIASLVILVLSFVIGLIGGILGAL